MATSNAGRKFPPEIYSQDEVEAILKSCSSRAPSGVRNRAMIVCGYRAGLRLNEVLNLYPKDVDLKEGTINVLHGKGDKARIVGLDAGACSIIQRWTDVRSKMKINGRNRLFCTLDGKPLSSAYVRALLPRLAKRANIEKRLHFHGFRHAFAWELSEAGVPVIQIKGLLGHSKLETTATYLDHVCPQERIDTLRRRDWSPSFKR